MAMTAQVKAELASTQITKTCCRKAEVASMLRFAGGLHIVSGRIVVEAELDTGAAARRLRTDIQDVYGHPSDRVVVLGVTGTSGKTTTTHLIEAGLQSADRTPGLIGTVGVRIAGADVPSALTTPEAPALQALLAVMAERGVDTAVMEVSSHALELGRTDGIRFAAGGFTNLSRDHLDFHPTMAAYFEAKARLFDERVRAVA